MSETIGSIQVVASINTKDYDAAKSKIEKGNSQLESGATKTSSAFSSAWIGAIAGVAASLTNVFLKSITDSVSGAIKRVDILNNSTRTFDNMGFSSTDAADAIKDLTKSIQGLPTPLDSAVSGMTSLAATYGDIKLGQKVFTALNDAILGFGGTTDMVNNAILQLSQLPMDGPLDAQTWMSLRNSGLTPVLVAMAKESGISVSAMKEAFGSGELKVQDFIDRLIKLDKDGGGGLKSLQKIAQDSTSGIGTGFANMQTAITRGMATIIKAIGSGDISKVISDIGTGFENALKDVAGLIGFIKDNKDIFTTLAAAIGGATLGIIAYNTAIKLAAIYQGIMNTLSILYSAYMYATASGLGVASAAQAAFNVALSANPIGIIIALIVALIAALAWFFTQTETGKAIFKSFGDTVTGVFTFIQSVWEEAPKWFAGIWDGIKSAFGAVGTWFKDTFSSAWQAVKNVFSAGGTIFAGIQDGISSVFKTVVNGIIGGINAVVAVPFNAINAALKGIKDVNIAGAKPFDWIPTISVPQIPMLANGGIVSSPTLAMIGEGKSSEAVIPLPKLDQMMNNKGGDTFNITVNASADMIRSENDKREFATMIVDSFNQTRKANGLPAIG